MAAFDSRGGVVGSPGSGTALGPRDGVAVVVSGGGAATVASGEDVGDSGSDGDGSGSVRGGRGTIGAGGAPAAATDGSDDGASSSRMTSAVAIISAPAIPTPVTILVIRGIGRP